MVASILLRTASDTLDRRDTHIIAYANQTNAPIVSTLGLGLASGLGLGRLKIPRTPKPQTSNLKPQTSNPKPPNPQTPKPGNTLTTLKPQPQNRL